MSHKPFYLVKRHDRLTDGKPTYYVRFRDDAGDILPWRSTGETSKTRAELWALEQYKNNTIAVRETLTFGAFAADWWVWDKCDYIRGKLARGQRISQAYAENQRRNLEHHILPAFKGKILSKITAQMIEGWIMGLREKKKLAPVTCNHILATLKVMLAEAHRLGVISTDPAAPVSPLQEIRKERKVLTIDEVRLLFREDRIEGIWGGDLRHYTLNLLAASTGVRMGEAQALQIRHVHEDYISIHFAWQRKFGLGEPKYGSARDIPIPTKTSKHLHTLITTSPYSDPEDFVFYGPNRAVPLDHKEISTALNAALAEIKIPEQARKDRGLTFHAHRHFFNSLMRGKIADFKLQRLTGHRTEAMTDYYTHLDRTGMADILKLQSETFE